MTCEMCNFPLLSCCVLSFGVIVSCTTDVLLATNKSFLIYCVEVKNMISFPDQNLSVFLIFLLLFNYNLDYVSIVHVFIVFLYIARPMCL